MASCFTSIAAAQSVVLQVDGTIPGSRFGAVVGAADRDGDGTPELVIGAPTGNGLGSVHVVSSVTGANLLTLMGAPSARFGASLVSVGDLDNDGSDELLIGAPFGSSALPLAGDVFVKRTSDGSTMFQFSGGSISAMFGASVAVAGDLDLDGVLDLLVGEPMADFGGQNSGSMHVFSGATGALLKRIDGFAVGDTLGSSVAGIGDVDGDGFPELLAGAEFADIEGTSSGSASVFSGMAGAELFTVSGGGAGGMLGHSVTALSDANGDGVGDFAAGAPLSNASGANSGFAAIYSGAGGKLLHSFVGSAGDQLGASVAGVGDQTGDGRGDLLVGSVTATGAASSSGRARLYSGADGFEMLGIDGEASGDEFGFSLGAVGDQNGDGFGELFIGAPSHASMGRGTMFSGCDGANTPYGLGCAGSGGFVPRLRLQGCPLREVPLAITVDEVLGGAPVVLHFGYEKGQVPLGGGCSLLISPVTAPSYVFIAVGVGPGQGSVTEPVTIPFDHEAGTITFQAFAGDPGTMVGFAASNGVLATIPP